ncbi:MAG TPA: aminotransferase class I/II-fold pyridoxal phosphate-dependent enzyme [Micromonosporaceae bacterium]
MAVHYQIAGQKAAEIMASVEAGIRSGALAPGAALPPVRVLAGELGLAAATVAGAYKALRQRGLVETAGRNGTRVRARPPVASRLARRPSVPAGAVDLSAGEPDQRLLPRLGPALRRLAAAGSEPLLYSGSGAWPELVAMSRDRLAADAVPAPAITVTSGALDAIERLLTAHLRPGDRVGVEDPGWANLIDLVAALGLVAVAVPVDDEGPTVDGLRAAVAAGISALVVTSRAQNPTGAAVSAARASGLRAVLAAAPDVLTIEDDHAAELASLPLASLAGAGSRWAFVRSVSKPYGPDLRLAVVAGDEASIARVDGRMRLGAGWVSTLLQRLLVQLWRDPAVADQIARAAAGYEQRRSSLLTALHQRGVVANGRTGINIWVPVEHEAAAVAGLAASGWAVAPGSLYRLRSAGGLRVTVSALAARDIDRLADAIAEATAGAPVRELGAVR